MARSCSFVRVFPLLFEPDEAVCRLLDPPLDDDEPRELADEPLLLDFEPLRDDAPRLELERLDRAPVDDAREPRLRDELPVRDDELSLLCRLSPPSLIPRPLPSSPLELLPMSFFAAPAAAVVATPRATAPATFVFVERSPMCLSTTTSDRFARVYEVRTEFPHERLRKPWC